MAKAPLLNLGDALLQGAKEPSSAPAVPIMPTSEMPMVLTLDEMAPNPDNPRTTRNPKYDEIKESIRARGLDTVPKMTKNPDIPGSPYIFSDGGNTRYAILRELYEETRDEHFYRFHVLFKPWPGRLKCLLGHLAENDVRGDLTFIDRALGVRKARTIHEETLGRVVTLRELSELLKLEGYPRTDCGYLPVSMREEIPQVLSAVVGTDPALQPVVAQLDTQFVSRIWNDKKITAHHGIIPTKHTGDLSKLSDEERNVYQLVRLHYLAQFMPLMEVDATEATFNIGGQLFRTRGNVVVKAGWKSLFGKMADDDEKGDEAVLPAMQAGQVCQVQGAEQKAQQTKPPAPYNDGTLIAAMTNAAAFVTDAALKKVLKENAGIGTEATRAGIIDTLVKRGFLVREKKALRSTPLGRSLVDVLPGTLTNPGLTALWEQMLDEVAAGKVSLDDFMAKQSQWVSQLVAQGKSQPLAMQVPPSPLCPVCGGKTSQRKGKNGSFWGCLNYPDCKGIVGDGGNAKTLQGQGRSSLPTRLKIKLR